MKIIDYNRLLINRLIEYPSNNNDDEKNDDDDYYLSLIFEMWA